MRIYLLAQIVWLAGLAGYWWIYLPRHSAAEARLRDEDSISRERTACLARVTGTPGNQIRTERQPVAADFPGFPSMTIPADTIETLAVCESRWDARMIEVAAKPYISEAYAKHFSAHRGMRGWLRGIGLLVLPLFAFLLVKVLFRR